MFEGVSSVSEKIGYHKAKIEKGTLGEITKIMEEYEELLDAHDQGIAVMEVVELTDLLGAIEAYSMNRWKLDLDALIKMTRATQRAFRSGART
jgi:hypothetical protein